LARDLGCSLGGIARVADGSSHHEEVGAGFDGVGRRHHALLIADVRAGGSDARRHEKCFLPKRVAKGGTLMRGCDESAHSGIPCELGKPVGCFPRAPAQADRFEGGRVEAGEHRHRQKPSRSRVVTGLPK